jgi:hypothetical protein
MTRRIFTLPLLTLIVAACANADASSDVSRAASDQIVPDAALATILVYKTATCGCCSGWVEHLKAAGFTVDARDVTDLMSVKRDAGVPGAMSSCHTSIVDGYVVEGHVPAEQVERLLADRPDIAGIAVPGMPTGSPGMEGRNPEPYQVLSIGRDGSAGVFAEIDPR